MNKKRLIVIGGGAAGFFCAVNAARLNPGLEVIILEKSKKILAKVRVSGGGRCNVTHACFSIADMIKQYPRGNTFLKKAFHHFFTSDTIAWFEERGVALKAEADGRMFPVSNSSETIINCLVGEANTYGVKIMMNRDVTKMSLINSRWSLFCKDGGQLESDLVCIACGGFPKSAQFDWLKQLGHHIEEPVPSLFTFNMPGNDITALMGVAVERAEVKIVGNKLSAAGPLLITHWGMSGPAVLKLSAIGARELAARNWHFSIGVNWLPGFNENNLREKIQALRFELAAQKVINRNPFALPNRLWEFLLKVSGVKEDIRWADLPAKEQNKLIRNLCAQEFAVKGKTTFKDEFVTAGGIRLEDIDVNSMESKIMPGLFFAGEVINVDGVTGGYNFQNAWTTGWIAAKGVGKKLEKI
jgi:predicted Rossmann fold flavoprotein